MKQLILFFSFLLLYNCKQNNLPEPTVISFENQKLLKRYNWDLLDASTSSYNMLIYDRNIVFIQFVDVNDKRTIENFDVLQKFYDDYKTKIEFIIAVDSKYQTKVKKLVKDNNYTFPYSFPLSPFPNGKINKDSLPHTFVVSKKARIVSETKGLANWDSKNFRKLIDGLIKQ